MIKVILLASMWRHVFYMLYQNQNLSPRSGLNVTEAFQSRLAEEIPVLCCLVLCVQGSIQCTSSVLPLPPHTHPIADCSICHAWLLQAEQRNECKMPLLVEDEDHHWSGEIEPPQ